MAKLRFYSQEECDEWLSGLQRRKPDAMPGVHTEWISYPAKPHGIRHLAHWTATSLTYRRPALLWITEWGIWPSSENWHLYYKLRQAYGDYRLLHEAPGHLFLEYEAEELASFLQMALLNGWGGYVLPQADYVNAFFSHDEHIAFYAERGENLAGVREAFRGKPIAE